MIDHCHYLLDFDHEYLQLIAKLDREPVSWHTDRPDRSEIIDNGKIATDYQGYGCGMLYNSYKEGQMWTRKYRTPGAYPAWSKERDDALAWGRDGLGNWNAEALKGFERKKDDDGVWKWLRIFPKLCSEHHQIVLRGCCGMKGKS